VGAACGAAHRIEGPAFGYPGQPRLQALTWRAAFEAMVTAALADAQRFGAALPAPPKALAHGFAQGAGLLDGPHRPCLTHFDLWDANVLVRQGDGGWELSAVIDWERAFWGDPLADVFALTLAGDEAERSAVLDGLAAGRGKRLAEDQDALRRLALYRAYLWLIMIAEAPSRGFAGSIRASASSTGRRLLRDLTAATA
jgi:aminoglycoside phosphotransferase (APT) family kinase protein